MTCDTSPVRIRLEEPFCLGAQRRLRSFRRVRAELAKDIIAGVVIANTLSIPLLVAACAHTPTLASTLPLWLAVFYVAGCSAGGLLYLALALSVAVLQPRPMRLTHRGWNDIPAQHIITMRVRPVRGLSLLRVRFRRGRTGRVRKLTYVLRQGRREAGVEQAVARLLFERDRASFMHTRAGPAATGSRRST